HTRSKRDWSSDVCSSDLVSGGVESANDGTLSVFAGGEAKAIATAKQVLKAVGTVYHLGPLGAGQVAKACNQMLVAAQMAALAEASVLAQRAGIELSEIGRASCRERG